MSGDREDHGLPEPDSTVAKRVREAVAEEREALRHSEERYRALVEAAPFGFCRPTPDGRVREANPALAKLLGYPVGQDLQSVDLVRDILVDPGSWLEIVEACMEGGRIQGMIQEWRRQDGSVVTVRLHGQASLDRAEKLEGFELFAEDATPLPGGEGESSAREDSARNDQTTRRIAHDLNNDLSLILLHSALIKTSIEAGDAVEDEDLEAIQDAAHRAAGTVQELRGSRKPTRR